MTRLIDVLTDEERVVKNRIFVLKEEEAELKSKNALLGSKTQKLRTTVRDLERQEENLRAKLKSNKLKRFKEDKVWPCEDWKWNTRATY